MTISIMFALIILVINFICEMHTTRETRSAKNSTPIGNLFTIMHELSDSHRSRIKHGVGIVIQLLLYFCLADKHFTAKYIVSTMMLTLEATKHSINIYSRLFGAVWGGGAKHQEMPLTRRCMFPCCVFLTPPILERNL